jgi:hypothetical protein
MRGRTMLRRVLAATALAAAGVLTIVSAPSAQATAVRSARISTAVSPASMSGSFNVAAFSPTKGKMGTKVTITGSGFKGTTAVAFHGKPASFRVISNTRIVATVPCGATTGRVTVSNAKGTARSARRFDIP